MSEAPEILYELAYDDYAAKPGLRASDLKTLKRSPAHWKAQQEAERPETDAFMFGRAVHSALENGEKFIETYAVEPEVNRRTNAGKEELSKWRASLRPGAVVVKPEWVDPIKGMLLAMRQHRLVGNMISKGTRESSVFVTDPETGIRLKCRPDLITDRGHLVDFKSTRDASDDVFTRDIFSKRGYFYALQLAHYCHCLRVAGIGSGESATIIAVEKEAPYGINIFPLDVGCLSVGEHWRKKLTAYYADCVSKNEWPSYPESPVQVVIPNWVEYES